VSLIPRPGCSAANTSGPAGRADAAARVRAELLAARVETDAAALDATVERIIHHVSRFVLDWTGA
jgi:hypothetical protein